MRHFPSIVNFTLSYFIAHSLDPPPPPKNPAHILMICTSTFEIALQLRLHGISIENFKKIQKILKKNNNNNNWAILKTTITTWLVVKNKGKVGFFIDTKLLSESKRYNWIRYWFLECIKQLTSIDRFSGGCCRILDVRRPYFRFF